MPLEAKIGHIIKDSGRGYSLWLDFAVSCRSVFLRINEKEAKELLETENLEKYRGKTVYLNLIHNI